MTKEAKFKVGESVRIVKDAIVRPENISVVEHNKVKSAIGYIGTVEEIKSCCSEHKKILYLITGLPKECLGEGRDGYLYREDSLEKVDVISFEDALDKLAHSLPSFMGEYIKEGILQKVKNSKVDVKDYKFSTNLSQIASQMAKMLSDIINKSSEEKEEPELASKQRFEEFMEINRHLIQEITNTIHNILNNEDSDTKAEDKPKFKVGDQVEILSDAMIDFDKNITVANKYGVTSAIGKIGTIQRVYSNGHYGYLISDLPKECHSNEHYHKDIGLYYKENQLKLKSRYCGTFSTTDDIHYLTGFEAFKELKNGKTIGMKGGSAHLKKVGDKVIDPKSGDNLDMHVEDFFRTVWYVVD